MDLQSLVYRHIADLKSRVAKDSISPTFLGNILEEMLRYMLLVHISEGHNELRIEFELQDGELIARGETKRVRCFVLEGWTDRTAEVAGWSIRRDTGDAVEDAAWGNKPKAKGFKGEIDICYTDTENDIGRGGKATYTVTAWLEGEEEPITETINL